MIERSTEDHGGAAARPASGQQHLLESGEHRATVVEVGGGVREYATAGAPILDGYGAHEVCPAGAGQLLCPWPNRLRDGRYRFEGEDLQLPISEPRRRTAIHGLVRWQSWTAIARAEDAEDSVVLTTSIHPQDGYPFALELKVRWSVGPAGLRADHEATNVGDRRCPFGFGAHPYLMVPGALVDDLELTLPAARCLATDDRLLPSGACDVAGGALDFTAARRIGPTRIDTAFTDLERDADGLWRARITGPGGAGVALWMDAAFTVAQVFTADDLPPPRLRRSIAIEPMTCEPNALESGRGLLVLEPGETWRGAWGVAPIQRRP